MMAGNDTFDDADVIAETPQKVKKKKSSKKLGKVDKTPLETQNYSGENVQHYLSNEFYVQRNYSEYVNMSVKYVNARYKRPYIFFEIKDVLGFTELYQPLNTNIKMIGVYKQKNVNVHYLMEFKKSCHKIFPMRILIDFKLSNLFPSEDQEVEVYGFIKFCRTEAACFPVFVVNFWTNISVDVNRYLKCLKQQKSYIPCCYKKTNFYFDGLKGYDVEESTDYSFAEIDESYLNKKVEYLEQIFHEVEQLMNISEDVFM